MHYKIELLCILLLIIITEIKPDVDKVQAQKNYDAALIQFNNKDYKQAIHHYQQALTHNPFLCDAYIGLSKSLEKTKQFNKAIKCLIQGCKINPNNMLLLTNLANMLTVFGYVDEAITIYKQIANKHISAHILHNLAFAYKTRGDMDNALTLIKHIRKQYPTYEAGQFSLGMTLLQAGYFQEGWKELEHFYFTTNRCTPILKKWIQEDNLTDKVILVRTEGGLGDTIQFIRYCKLLKNQGAYVILECQKPLYNLLQRCDFYDELYPQNHMKEYKRKPDAFSTAMTLAGLYCLEEHSLPQDIPYIYPDPSLCDYWKSKVKGNNNIKIGLCWEVSLAHAPAHPTVGRRGIPLQILSQIGKLPHVSLYSLQKHDGLEQLKKLPSDITITVFDELDEQHGSFMDTAALISHLDLVITVDTATAHVAGALGIPVWILIPYSADWRWIVGRTNSPWYPTMKIFKRSHPHDWDTVIKNITNELEQFIIKKTTS